MKEMWLHFKISLAWAIVHLNYIFQLSVGAGCFSVLTVPAMTALISQEKRQQKYLIMIITSNQLWMLTGNAAIELIPFNYSFRKYSVNLSCTKQLLLGIP